MTFDPHTALDRRFPRSRWHIDYEVSSIGGGMKTAGARWADCIAIGKEDSESTHVIHGIEIKHSRSDIILELKNPDKCKPFLTLCHYWWMLCLPSGLDLAEKLPDHWGIATTNEDGKFSVIRDAPLTEKPEITPAFVYSLMNARMREAKEDARLKNIKVMTQVIADDEELFDFVCRLHKLKEDENREHMRRMWDNIE